MQGSWGLSIAQMRQPIGWCHELSSTDFLAPVTPSGPGRQGSLVVVSGLCTVYSQRNPLPLPSLPLPSLYFSPQLSPLSCGSNWSLDFFFLTSCFEGRRKQRKTMLTEHLSGAVAWERVLFAASYQITKLAWAQARVLSPTPEEFKNSASQARLIPLRAHWQYRETFCSWGGSTTDM